MTKKLEDILNLPNVKEEFKKVDKKEKEIQNANKTISKSKNLDPETHKNLQKSYAEFDKIAASLPQVKGLGDLSDLELDKLAVEAEESYKTLMDLGMNVDSRYSGRIFEVASTMLRNAIDAKSNKIDKKLKTLIKEQKKREDYLVYEIFIEDVLIKELNKESDEKLKENNAVEELTENKVVVEEQDGIIIEAENASYNNKKNPIDVEKSIEKVAKAKTNEQITIDDLIENIKEKGFENTAIQFSSSPTAQQGGRLGWVSESKFSKLLLKFIKKTKIGTITEPIPISGGILILKVENKRVEENKMDLDKKMKELIEIEKNNQLNNFSRNYFNQVKNNIKIKYFND